MGPVIEPYHAQGVQERVAKNIKHKYWGLEVRGILRSHQRGVKGTLATRWHWP